MRSVGYERLWKLVIDRPNITNHRKRAQEALPALSQSICRGPTQNCSSDRIVTEVPECGLSDSNWIRGKHVTRSAAWVQ